MRRFLAVLLGIMMVVGVVNGAIAASITFDNEYPITSSLEAETIGKEFVASNDSTAVDTAFFFKLSGLSSALGNGAAIRLAFSNMYLGSIASGQALALYRFNGVDWDVIASAPSSGGATGADFVVYTNGTALNINDSDLALAVVTSPAPATRTTAQLGQVPFTLDGDMAEGGSASAEVTNIRTGGAFAEDLSVPENEGTYFKTITTLALTSGEGFDTIDVNEGRKLFIGDKDESANMNFRLFPGDAPTPGNDTSKVEEVVVTISTDTWQGVEFGDDENPDVEFYHTAVDPANKLNPTDPVYNETERTYTVTFEGNVDKLLTKKIFVEIDVDGETPLSTRTWYVAADLGFATNYNDISFDAIELGKWLVNGYQAIVPFLSPVPNNGTNIVLTNNSGADADVFFDIIAIQPAVDDLSAFQNIVIPEKATLPKNGVQLFSTGELAEAAGIPVGVGRFSVLVTVTAPTDQITGTAFKKQGASFISVPLMHSPSGYLTE